MAVSASEAEAAAAAMAEPISIEDAQAITAAQVRQDHQSWDLLNVDTFSRWSPSALTACPLPAAQVGRGSCAPAHICMFTWRPACIPIADPQTHCRRAALSDLCVAQAGNQPHKGGQSVPQRRAKGSCRVAPGACCASRD